MEHKTLILLVGPSASGKSSIARCISERYGLTISKSHTTRAPREKEKDDYYYVTPEEFRQLDLCEHTEYAGNFYGVSQEELNKADIHICDGNGVKAIKKQYKGKKTIYVVRLRVSDETVTARLKARGMSEQEILLRKASDMKSLNHLISDFDIASGGSEACIPEIANIIMGFVDYHEKNTIGKWIITDPDCVQLVKMIDRNVFQCIQLVEFPDDTFQIAESTINLLEYSSEELLEEIKPFGYRNVVQIHKCSDTATRQIIAECVFENHALRNLRSETFGSFEEAERWILEYTRKGE